MEYNLPDDDCDYTNALNGFKYRRTIDDVYEFLRNKTKYCELTEEEAKIYYEVYDHFIEILNDNKVDLFE